MIRKLFIFFLFICLIVTVYSLKPFSIIAIISVLIIQFFYHYFYTEQPKRFFIIALIGISLSIINLFLTFNVTITVFAALCIIECARVILMAILNYPETIQDLKDLTEDLEKRVNERTAELKQTNKKLKEANERLRELDKMKSSFVSQASHDLRTPLTAIKGSLDNLSIGIAGELNKKQMKILSRATRSVDRLTNLVNDILDLSRIESGRIVLEKQDVYLDTIIQSVLQENKPAADLKQIQLDYNLQTDSVVIHADPGKIERVIGELVNNAIKYTSDNGFVNVELCIENDHALLIVEDSGIGMSHDDCQKIWDRFYRSSSSQEMAKGSGLGLSIAKELIELHGGTIRVESEKEHGTSFFTYLPLTS
jgi:signal transduction histidine kinase